MQVFATMNKDFINPPDRSGTGSLKWEKFAGREILPMWVADMDLPSPPAVMEALHARVDHGVFGYTLQHDGVVSAVQDYLKSYHKIDVEGSALLWFPGLVPALNTAARAFAEPDEAVITLTPVYPPFLSAPGNQGRIVQPVALSESDDGYSIDFDALEAVVTAQSKIFYLCNPHNPVGRVYRRDELEAILRFCEKHDLIIIADEIHCDLILDEGLEHISMLSLEGAVERTVGLYAPSKTYNLPGLACSYIVAPDRKLRSRFQRAAQGMITEVNCMGYIGCEAAYRHGQDWLSDLLELLRLNRDALYGFVKENCPKIQLRPMESTYLAWLDVRQLGLKDPVGHFEGHGLGLSDGRFFGHDGYIRINLGCPEVTMKEGLRRLKLGYDAAVGSN